MSYKNWLPKDSIYGTKVKEIERVLPYQDYLNIPYEDFYLQFKEKCVEWNKKDNPMEEVEKWVHDNIRMDDMLTEHFFKRVDELNLNTDEINNSVGKVYINASIRNGIFSGVSVEDRIKIGG